jgi:hypothetical protein
MWLGLTEAHFSGLSDRRGCCLTSCHRKGISLHPVGGPVIQQKGPPVDFTHAPSPSYALSSFYSPFSRSLHYDIALGQGHLCSRPQALCPVQVINALVEGLFPVKHWQNFLFFFQWYPVGITIYYLKSDMPTCSRHPTLCWEGILPIKVPFI